MAQNKLRTVDRSFIVFFILTQQQTLKQVLVETDRHFDMHNVYSDSEVFRKKKSGYFYRHSEVVYSRRVAVT